MYTTVFTSFLFTATLVKVQLRRNLVSEGSEAHYDGFDQLLLNNFPVFVELDYLPFYLSSLKWFNSSLEIPFENSLWFHSGSFSIRNSGISGKEIAKLRAKEPILRVYSRIIKINVKPAKLDDIKSMIFGQ